MNLRTIVCVLGVGVCGVALIGCSKPATDTPPVSDETSASSDRSPGERAGGPTPAAPSGSIVAPAPSVKPRAMPEKALNLERAYHEAPDSKDKLDIVYRLGDLGTLQAVEVLGRVFETETDPDLKENILSALWVVDGLDREKLPIYSAAVLPTQPEEVRTEAIDGLGDLEIPEAITVLQSLLNDPSEEIREAAKDAISLVEASLAAP